jgi:hypothetical protein
VDQELVPFYSLDLPLKRSSMGALSGIQFLPPEEFLEQKFFPRKTFGRSIIERFRP